MAGSKSHYSNNFSKEKPNTPSILPDYASSLTTKTINNIWDDPYIVKEETGWKCLWCNNAFVGVDPARALTHVSGIRVYEKPGIGFCLKTIPPEKLLIYKTLALKKNQNRVQQDEKSLMRVSNLSNNNQNMALEYLFKKQKIDDSRQLSSTSLNKSYISDVTMKEFDSKAAIPPSLIQTRLDFNNNNPNFVLNKAELDHAIADFIHSKGLLFRLTEDIKFKQILAKASKMSPTYVPPKRKEIAGELLNSIYDNYNKNHLSLLEIDVNKYGLSIMGDGATIKKKPLFNIIVSGVSCPIYVAEIHDGSCVLASGNTKNAKYVTKLCREVLEKIDPKHTNVDLALFDGASVVQTAGTCLQYIYLEFQLFMGWNMSQHCFAVTYFKKPK